MISLATHKIILFGQAYGQGAFGGSRYQDGFQVGPFTLPDVGSVGLAAGSLLALALAVGTFIILERRSTKRT